MISNLNDTSSGLKPVGCARSNLCYVTVQCNTLITCLWNPLMDFICKYDVTYTYYTSYNFVYMRLIKILILSFVFALLVGILCIMKILAGHHWCCKQQSAAVNWLWVLNIMPGFFFFSKINLSLEVLETIRSR